MRYHAGILDGRPRWADEGEVLILAHTPGVPLEWIYAAMDLGERKRARLRKLIDATQTGEFPGLGVENAASANEADGWRMLEVVGPKYAGAVPLWSKLALCNDQRSAVAIAQVLGVNEKKVRRWRKNHVFDPLTGVRLIPNRGTPCQ